MGFPFAAAVALAIQSAVGVEEAGLFTWRFALVEDAKFTRALQVTEDVAQRWQVLPVSVAGGN